MRKNENGANLAGKAPPTRKKTHRNKTAIPGVNNRKLMQSAVARNHIAEPLDPTGKICQLSRRTRTSKSSPPGSAAAGFVVLRPHA